MSTPQSTAAGNRALVGNVVSLRVDARDSLGLLRNGRYEPYETDLLLSLIQPGSVVIDVGANIGYYTVQFARATGPHGVVYAFEPEPGHAGLLDDNVRTNGLSNVTIVRKAAAEAAGTRRLFLAAENLGDHRMYDSGDARPAIDIDAVRIDDVVVDDGRPISLIKMDVQGAEPWALAGMREMLDRHPEAWIATEFWPAGLRLAGSDETAYLAALRALGTPLLRIDERRKTVTPLDMGWLHESVSVERGNHTNLLVPRRDWFSR